MICAVTSQSRAITIDSSTTARGRVGDGRALRGWTDLAMPGFRGNSDDMLAYR
jgi:hypothetical protein